MSSLRRGLLLLVIFAVGAAQAGEPLGRLFLTPELRAELDAGRAAAAGGTAGTDGATLATSATPPAIVLNGVVRRARGPAVVWVNGARAGAGNAPPVRLTAGPDPENRVTLENPRGTSARLKPGQSWDPATGRVTDCHDCTSRGLPADAPATVPGPSTAAP